MNLPSWLTAFLPAWEQAAWVVIATAAVTQAWKLWRKDVDGRKPRGYIIAAFSMGIGSCLGILVVWADTRDIGHALAGGLKVGLAAPLLWWAFVAFSRRYAPWLAAVVGECRRNGNRQPGTWSEQKRREKALFEDTEQLSQADLEKWRKEHSKHDD